MKKILMALFVFGMILNIAQPGYCILRQDRDVLRGTLERIDASKGQVVVTDEATGQKRTFTLRRWRDEDLILNKQVIVIYQRGSDIATSVKPIKK